MLTIGKHGAPVVAKGGGVSEEISYLALHAWITAVLGREQECRECAAAARGRGAAAGTGWAVSEAHLALAELELGLGNPGAALEHYEQVAAGPLPAAGQAGAGARFGRAQPAVASDGRELRHVLTLLLQDRWLVGLSHLVHKLLKFWNTTYINMSGFFRHLFHTSFFDILRRTICLSCIIAHLVVRLGLHVTSYLHTLFLRGTGKTLGCYR